MSRINWRGALRASTKAEQTKQGQCVETLVYWNGTCLQQEQFTLTSDKPFSYRIGETPACRFMVDRQYIQTSEFAFFEISGGEVTVNIPAFSRGVAQQGDVSESFTETDQIRRHFLALHGQVTCELGPWTFVFRRIVQDDAAKYGMGLSFAPSRWTYISIAAHAVFFLLIGMIPPEASGMNFDEQIQKNRFSKYMIPVAEHHDVELADVTPDEPAGGTRGTAQAGDEGKAGDPKSKPSKGRMAIAGPRTTKRPVIGKEHLKDMAAQAGILSYLKQPSIVSPFGEDITIGRDPENVLGNLIGDAPGASFGYGGFGIRGAGRGGGGDASGTVGVDKNGNRFGFSRTGNCVGSECRGEGWGNGTGVGKLKGEPKGKIRIRMKANVLSGSLSKDIIRRYIRQKIAQIRFCYEKELAANESLSGRVTVMFIINRSGAVTSSGVKDSTIGNVNVETCVANVVKRITFPSPPDGGTVIVNYPFNLVSSAR